MENGIGGIGTEVVDAVVSGVGQAVSDTVGLVTSLLPLAMTVFATIWGIRRAIRFFKSASN